MPYVEPIDNLMEQVNAKMFWDNVNKSCVDLLNDKNMTPTMSNWAAFIPEKSRKSEMVFNTEYLKGKADKEQDEYLKCLSEEQLEQIFEMKNVTELRRLCKECGINAENMTKIRCIASLTSAIKSVTDVDKFFLKIWNASGGILTATCPHGIVYAIKHILKAESPRDIGDILLSLKHPPNIAICDIPHMLAANTNKRCAGFFSPHQGRVLEPTDENVKLAKEKKLEPVSWGDWLDRRFNVASSHVTSISLESMNVHPLTLTSACYALYDKFHQDNTKQPKEVLRRTELVEELSGINTETAEQVNAFLSKALNFLVSCSPLHHIQLVKFMLAERNFRKNKKMMEKMSKAQPDWKFGFDEFGRIHNMNSVSLGNYSVPFSAPLLQPTNNVLGGTGSSTDSNSNNNNADNVQDATGTNDVDDVNVQFLDDAETISIDDLTETIDLEDPTRTYDDIDVINTTNIPPCTIKNSIPTSVPSYDTATKSCVDFNIGNRRVGKKFAQECDEADIACKMQRFSVNEQLFSLCGPIFKGLHNPFANCWFNSVMLLLRNSIGAGNLFEDSWISGVPVDNELSHCFNPVIESLSILKDSKLLEFQKVTQCIKEGFDSNVAGKEEDPLKFYLQILSAIDCTSLVLNSSNIFGFEIKYTHTCFSCSSKTNKTEPDHFVSLALDGTDAAVSLNSLVVKYFEDEKIENRVCSKCNFSSCMQSKMISKSPNALTIHLKRYDNSGIKSIKTVIHDEILILSSTTYILRGIIVHKGRSLSTGHYSTIFYEPTLEHYLELDGIDPVLVTSNEDCHTGGYIYLYENERLVTTLASQWYSIAFFMLSLYPLFSGPSSTLRDLLVQLDRLIVTEGKLTLSSSFLQMIAAKLSRCISLRNGEIPNYDMISKILGFRESKDSYFMYNCYCDAEFGCGSSNQKHFVKMGSINCQELCIEDVFEEVNEVFDTTSYSYCYDCKHKFSIKRGDPILISDVIIVNTKGRVLDLSYDSGDVKSLSFFNKFEVVGVITPDASMILKQGECYKASNSTIECVPGGSSSMEVRRHVDKIVVLKGEKKSTEIREEMERSIGGIYAKPSSAVLEGNSRHLLNGCLFNILKALSLERHIVLFQRMLLHSEFEKLGREFFKKLSDGILYIHNTWHSDMSAESILFSIKLKKVHTFMVFDFDSFIYVVDIQKKIFYGIGNIELSSHHKFVAVINILFDGEIFVYKTVGFDSILNITKLKLIKVACCILLNIDVEVEVADNDIHLVMLLFNGTELRKELRQHCKFFNCLPLNKPVLNDIFVCRGDLFNVAVPCTKILKRVKEVYAERSIGVLDDIICLNVLEFLMENLDVIKAYYLLDDKILSNGTIKHIESILNNTKYLHVKNIINFKEVMDERFLSVPNMIYRCMQDSLYVILIDDQHSGAVHVNRGCLTSPMYQRDYIDMVMTKYLLCNYMVQRGSGIKVEDLLVVGVECSHR